MPKPISRRELIRRLRAFGWIGPVFDGGKHMVMDKGTLTIRIPNPHGSDLDWTLVKRLLKQAGIDSHEWDNFGK
jgi:predicted RNA binding protein YcfA (HicA-like mRNA interferase family)